MLAPSLSRASAPLVGRAPEHEARQDPRRRRSRGQGVVEFAFILPLLLVLTLGMVDFARVFSAYISLTNAVREGALYGSLISYTQWCATGGAVPCPAGTSAANKDTDPNNIAYRISTDAVSMTAAEIVMAVPQCTTSTTASFATSSACSIASANYQYVKVSASYAVPLLTPVLSSFFGGAVDISASTVARIVSGS